MAALMRCDQVNKGMRSSERIVTVIDARGRREYLALEEDFLNKKDGQYWITVGVINEDKNHQAVLIELPQEAASGANRLWAKKTDLLGWDRSKV